MIQNYSDRCVREASDALRPSTVAAHVVLRVTCHQRHWRQHHVCFALGCDGEAVREISDALNAQQLPQPPWSRMGWMSWKEKGFRVVMLGVGKLGLVGRGGGLGAIGCLRRKKQGGHW
jgi:hypothetical protein